MALHGGRLGGVGVAEVVAVGAVATAVLVGRDVELAHLGAAHVAGAALLSLAAGRPRLLLGLCGGSVPDSRRDGALGSALCFSQGLKK